MLHYWAGSSINTSTTTYRSGTVVVGGTSSSDNGKFNVPSAGSSVSIIGINDSYVSHRLSAWMYNPNNNTTSKGNFALMAQAEPPNTSSSGYFNGAIAGRAVNSSDNVMIQGELGKAQTTSTGRWINAVMGTVNAGNARAYGGSSATIAAVKGFVMGGSYSNVYCGHFQGAPTWIESMASPGGDYAEWLEKEESTMPGDLIGINLNTGKARKYRQGDILVGVHSENPAIVGNQAENDMGDTHVLVALVGQVNINESQVDIIGRIVKTKDDKMVGVILSNGRVLMKRQM
jgi:hypothetical protein